MSILTTSQQSNALSKGKKRKYDKVAKIALDNPFPDYWPVLDAENTEIITSCLSRILVLNNPKPAIPWHRLRSMTPKEKVQEIKVIKSQHNISPEIEEQRRQLVFGLNQVTKLLEKSQLVSCLLSANIEPVTIAKHLVTLSAVRNIPVLVVPNLSDIVKRYSGISSISFGLKIGASEPDSRYHELQQLIETVSLKHPVPNKLKQWYNIIDIASSHLPNVTTKSGSDDVEVEEKKCFDLNDIYCYRTSDTYRSFIPENYRKIHCSSNTAHETYDKSENNDIKDDKNVQLKRCEDGPENIQIYQPMKLKHIRKNLNRIHKLFKKK